MAPPTVRCSAGYAALAKLSTGIALLGAWVGILGLSFPSHALRYRPPSNLQRPSGRQGAATRTDCITARFQFVPLVPSPSNFGQTTAPYPTVYWYQANHRFTWAKFELFAVQTSTLKPDPDPLYQSTFKLQRGNRLARLTLPSQIGLPPLQIGQEYLWKVTLLCSQGGPEDESASGSQQSIQGWIQRVAPRVELQRQLGRSPRRYERYAEQGIWYDALHDLASQRQQRPEDLQLNRDWRELLKETRL